MSKMPVDAKIENRKVGDGASKCVKDIEIPGRCFTSLLFTRFMVDIFLFTFWTTSPVPFKNKTSSGLR
jgi:hypothetical protein